MISSHIIHFIFHFYLLNHVIFGVSGRSRFHLFIDYEMLMEGKIIPYLKSDRLLLMVSFTSAASRCLEETMRDMPNRIQHRDYQRNTDPI